MCGHELGEYCTIAAGAVVTSDVKPHALMAGVPTRQIGWTCECGQVLNKQKEMSLCPYCQRKYKIVSSGYIELRY